MAGVEIGYVTEPSGQGSFLEWVNCSFVVGCPEEHRRHISSAQDSGWLPEALGERVLRRQMMSSGLKYRLCSGSETWQMPLSTPR